MIEYRVEILRGIENWEHVSWHKVFAAALQDYYDLDDDGHEVRIVGHIKKEWVVL